MSRSARLVTQYLLVVVAALLLNFTLPRLAPGDPVDYLAPPDSTGVLTSEQRQEILAKYDLDGSVGDQLVAYVSNMFRGDLGISIRTGQPVVEIVGVRLMWSLLLVGIAVTVSTLLGVLLGFAAGWRRGSKTDISLLGAVIAVDALPAFFVGLMLLP